MHYYLSAVSRCRFAGTAEDVIYCQQLANLCVLQLYDRSSIACRDHLAIVAARSNQLYNSVNNWVTGTNSVFFIHAPFYIQTALTVSLIRCA